MAQYKVNFLRGAAVLVACNIIVKLIGAFYKIPLQNAIGSDGMGLYTTAYDVFIVFYTLSATGLSVAVSKLVSENVVLGRGKQVRRILKVSLGAFALFSMAIMIIMISFAEPFVRLMKNERAYTCVVIMAPAIFFVIIVAAFKGYFQGFQNMVPTAISQIIDAAFQMIGLIVTFYLLIAGYSMEIVAAGAVFGVSTGTLAGAIYMIIRYRFGKRERMVMETGGPPDSISSTLKSIISISIPVSLSASIVSFSVLIDKFIIYNRLQDMGYTESQANILNGTYSGMAITLFNMPIAIIAPVAISVLPAIASTFARGDREGAKRTMESAMRINSIMAMPSAFILMFMAEPILRLLYPFRPDDVLVAIPLLTSLGFGLLFVSTVNLTNAILQGLGMQRRSMFNMILGTALKLVINFILIGMPSINIYGAPLGMNIAYMLIFILNMYSIMKASQIVPDVISVFAKPFLCAIISAGSMRFLYQVIMTLTNGVLQGLWQQIISFAVAGFVGISIYFVAVILVKLLNKDDVLMIPKGYKLYNLLKKRGLMR